MKPELLSKSIAGVVAKSDADRRRSNIVMMVFSVLTLLGFAVPIWIVSNPLSWVEISAFLLFYFMAVMGISVSRHRYLTHRSFETSRPMRALLCFLGVIGGPGSLVMWVADHRRHHAHTDHCGDVHSPVVDDHCHEIDSLKGFWHAHLGWIRDDTRTDPKIWAKELLDDPIVMFFSRTSLYWFFGSLFVLPGLYGLILGGPQHVIGTILVGGLLRSAAYSQATLAVNSICHTMGTRRFEQENTSTNNAIVAIVSLGEGWHNNHHRFPRSAHFGIAWYEIDVLGSIIGLMERLGLVWNVVRVTPSMVERALQTAAKTEA
jgi:stearoyl-CoA desaturase (delta-9 desaturase)